MRQEKKMEPKQLTVDRAGLARILHRSPLTVARQMSSSSNELPPAVRGTKPRIWRIETIDKWLRARELSIEADHLQTQSEHTQVNVHAASVRRKAGRPRKTTNRWEANSFK